RTGAHPHAEAAGSGSRDRNDPRDRRTRRARHDAVPGDRRGDEERRLRRTRTEGFRHDRARQARGSGAAHCQPAHRHRQHPQGRRRLEGGTRGRSRASSANAGAVGPAAARDEADHAGSRTMNRRRFLKSAAAGVGAGALATAAHDAAAQNPSNVPESMRALTSMMKDVARTSVAGRAARLEKAHRLMIENRIAAIVLEGGSSMFYFTGVRWGLSERPFVTVIPAKGDLAWVAPGFEEARAREL